MRPRLTLVGAGRVGLTLARLWQTLPPKASAPRLHAVINPSTAGQARAREWLGPDVPVLSSFQEAPALAEATDIWLLAVPDSQIAQVAAALAEHIGQPARATGLADAPPNAGWPAAPRLRGAATQPGTPEATAAASETIGPAAAQHLALPRPPIAWHCSGFLPAAALAPLQALGWAAASVHPALSFAHVASACAQFPGTLVALEGDAAATAPAAQAFGAVGGVCWPLAAEHKPLYHGAAVFASNFLPVLSAVAQELWQGSGVPPEHIPALAQGFVRRVADNLLALGPAAALTGPAARGDTAVLAAQGAAMAARDAELGAAYRALSVLAGRLARGGKVLG